MNVQCTFTYKVSLSLALSLSTRDNNIILLRSRSATDDSENDYMLAAVIKDVSFESVCSSSLSFSLVSLSPLSLSLFVKHILNYFTLITILPSITKNLLKQNNIVKPIKAGDRTK